MKKFNKFLSLIMLVLMGAGFNSCEKRIQPAGQTGSFEFALSFDETDLTGLKSDGINDSLGVHPYYAMLTVVNMDSIKLLEDEMIPLYRFGDGYHSEKIELKAGHFMLIKFLIINPAGQVIFACPIAGSPKAYLVKEPLPIDFRIQAGETTRLSPEVLPVGDEPPSEFGYSSFGFSVVRPLPFYIGVMIDNPLIMSAEDNGSFAPTLLTDAVLSVYHPDGWSYKFKLESKINKIVIRGGAEAYKFVIQKKDFEPVRMEVPAEKLMNTSAENPLIVRIGPGMDVLVLQPGPDNGKDAMVSNLEGDDNFGKHPYFEALWKSDSTLRVMRETRSLIYFRPADLPKSAIIKKVTLTLFYDSPVPWDGYDSLKLDSTLMWTPYASADAIKYGAVLQQIVETWEESEVTWNTQPKTIEANEVFIRPFIKNSNFITLDVTGFWMPLQELAAPNYGMLLKLVMNDAVYFPGFRFASSDFREPGMRPMLKIYYSLPTL